MWFALFAACYPTPPVRVPAEGVFDTASSLGVVAMEEGGGGGAQGAYPARRGARVPWRDFDAGAATGPAEDPTAPHAAGLGLPPLVVDGDWLVTAVEVVHLASGQNRRAFQGQDHAIWAGNGRLCYAWGAAVRCEDTLDGARAWEARLPGALAPGGLERVGQVLVAHLQYGFPEARGAVAGLRWDDGAELWRFDLQNTLPLVVVAGRVLISGPDACEGGAPCVLAVDPATGAVVASQPLPPVASDGASAPQPSPGASLVRWDAGSGALCAPTRFERSGSAGSADCWRFEGDAFVAEAAAPGLAGLASSRWRVTPLAPARAGVQWLLLDETELCRFDLEDDRLRWCARVGESSVGGPGLWARAHADRIALWGLGGPALLDPASGESLEAPFRVGIGGWSFSEDAVWGAR